MKESPTIRSALFVPAIRPDRVDKAVKTEADAIVIDLEDSVPIPEKERARVLAAEKLIEHRDRLLIIRINSIDSTWVQEDLDMVAGRGARAIVCPKVNAPEDMAWLDGELCSLEEQNKLARGDIKVFPLIETARGVRDADRIMAAEITSGRLWTAFLGAADYTADMGIDLTAGGEELAYARARLAVACRAAELEPPIDTPYMIDINDVDSCGTDAMRAKSLGFQGKQCIHPTQVAIVNQVFSPDEKRVNEALRIMAAYQEALEADSGAIQLDGKFIDLPIVERARKVLALHNRINNRQPR